MDFDRWFNQQGKPKEPELNARDQLYEAQLNKAPDEEELPDGLHRGRMGRLYYHCRRCGNYDAEWCGEISEWDESFETFGCGSGPYCMP